MKTCKKCKVEKEISEFYFYKSKNYRDGFCKVCRSENNRNWRRNTYTLNETYIRENLLKEGNNLCFVCEKVKPLSAFRKSNHVKTGYLNTCKTCLAISNKNTKLKAAYGISLEDYDKLFATQNYKCAVCKQLLTTQDKPSVDHCHITGRVRGILCNNCNRGIGLLKDDPQVLISAARYLKLAQYKSGELGETPVVDNTEPSYPELKVG